jgi:anti-sigma B factor antagonist
MAFDKRMVDGTAVVALTGDVDLQSSPGVRQQLLACFEDTARVVVDLAGVTYIDSSGVASLVEAFQMARKKGGAFSLVSVSPAVMRVLNLARLDKVFAIHPSVDAAIAAQS